MKLLSLLVLLASCLPSLGQIWGSFSDLTYMNQRAAAAGGGGISCDTSNLWVYPVLQQQLVDNDYATWTSAEWIHQKIHNTSASAVTVKKARFKFQVGGATANAYVFVRTNTVTSAVPNVGGYASNTIPVTGAWEWYDFVFAAADAPTIPANTDFFLGLKYDTATSASYNQSGVNTYETTDYGNLHNTDNFPINKDATFEVYVCASASVACTSSNLFLQIITGSVSASAGADGDFAAQKIKNNSLVPITIMRLSMGTQTNNGSGPPIWTGYVRDNPDFAAGSTYGSASISTNRMRPGVGQVDFFWTAGTEPVIPPLTDFYVGWKVNYNGASAGSVSTRYEDFTAGGSYIDTNYRAYLNGANFGGVTTRDYADIDIWACYERPNCTGSNLWSSPILQQQLTVSGDLNMTFNSAYYGQMVRNTSSSAVMIKKLRFGLVSSGVNVDTRAACTQTGDWHYGQQYGGFSDVVNIPAGMSAQLVDYVWPVGFEPIIPPNTDFVIGVFPFANNQVRVNLNGAGGGTSYQTTAWNYKSGGFVDAFDTQFEVWICQ
jgi:hypothetical protein